MESSTSNVLSFQHIIVNIQVQRYIPSACVNKCVYFFVSRAHEVIKLLNMKYVV